MIIIVAESVARGLRSLVFDGYPNQPKFCWVTSSKVTFAVTSGSGSRSSVLLSACGKSVGVGMVVHTGSKVPERDSSMQSFRADEMSPQAVCRSMFGRSVKVSQGPQIPTESMR